MSDVVPDGSGKYLKVKFIQRKDNKMMAPAYLMDEGSAVSWTPNAAKLASEVGVKLANYDEDWYGSPVSVVEMDGAVDKLEEIIYLESQLCNTGTKVRPPLLHLPTSRRRGVPSRGPCMRAAREPTLMCPPPSPPRPSRAQYYGELTEQITKNKDSPGSDNGTGLMQTLCSFKIREVYEKLTA